MSEKTLWKKLIALDNVYGDRLEGCNMQGIPDAVINVAGITMFCELKDWSGKKRHPLSIEQMNFLNEYGGIVVIALRDSRVAILSKEHGLKPLTKGDVLYAAKHGHVVSLRTLCWIDILISEKGYGQK